MMLNFNCLESIETMNALLHTKQSLGKTGPKLVIWLVRGTYDTDVSPWVIERVNIISTRIENTVTFKKGIHALNALQPAVWSFLQGYLPKRTSEHVFSARDAVLEIGCSVLSGLSVTSLKEREGKQRLLLTFNEIIGELKNFFLPNTLMDNLCETECNLSTRTLSDIVLPVLNIAVTEPIDVFKESGKSIEAFLHKIKQKNRTEFYAQLLIRFVAAKDAQRDINLSNYRMSLPSFDATDVSNAANAVASARLIERNTEISDQVPFQLDTE